MKFVKFVLIPLFLVAGYLLFISYPYFFSKINNSDSLGLLSLVEEQSTPLKQETNSERVTDQLDNHLLKGEKIGFRITATEDNLGIVLVRFTPLSAKVKDSVVFRIKEAGNKKWHYENVYHANQFQPNQYFTFGFPPLVHSKEKVYIFEIESKAGTYSNSIGVSEVHPHVAVVYKFHREQLKNITTLSSFVKKKLTYAINNMHLLQNWQLLVVIFLIYGYLYIRNNKKKENKSTSNGRYFPHFLKKMKATYRLQRKVLAELAKKISTTMFYKFFLETEIKKRIVIGLLLFFIAFLYRFASASVDQLGIASFYSGLGGAGDYDQFIRASTCALQFCPAILGQNFVIESSVLGMFYKLFGFAGGLQAYLYLMMVLSSIIAILPYLILSRKNIFTIGGIIGSLFLATSEYFIHMALALPPDNGSLFTFSMFYLVYLFTMQYGTIRWLIFLGFIGAVDGLNKLTMLMNDIPVLLLFIPIFLYEKAKKIKMFPYITIQPKYFIYALVPFLVFLLTYSGWEVIVQIKFNLPYYLRAVLEGNPLYASSTSTGADSLKDIFFKNIGGLYYIAGLAIVMQKRIIEYADLNTLFLAPIFIGLLYFTFKKSQLAIGKSVTKKNYITKLFTAVIFFITIFILLILFNNNYLDIQEIEKFSITNAESYYRNVFFFSGILFLFFLNFKWSAIRLIIPILPYYIILIILTKNAPWGRMWAHVTVWSIVLLCFLLDWIFRNAKRDRVLRRIWIGPILLSLFIIFYFIPKVSDIGDKLWTNYQIYNSEVTYLQWVNLKIPKNAVILAGGKSDLIIVSENIQRPIIYNTLWSAAILIKPHEIPKVKPSDFAILQQLKITKMPGIPSSTFNIIHELQNKSNFKKNTYLILEDDISLWRRRLAGEADGLFSTTSATLLQSDDYAIEVYNVNTDLKKGIYELKLKETENF